MIHRISPNKGKERCLKASSRPCSSERGKEKSSED